MSAKSLGFEGLRAKAQRYGQKHAIHIQTRIDVDKINDLEKISNWLISNNHEKYASPYATIQLIINVGIEGILRNISESESNNARKKY